MSRAPATDSEPDRAIIVAAFQSYIAQRRERVAPFCARHFSLAGAWQIHRKAWGQDLWKAPANALWAGPYLLSRGAAALARRFGWSSASRHLARLSPGFATAVGRELEWLIFTELLELPIKQDTRESTRDALLEQVAADAVIADLARPELAVLGELAGSPGIRTKLDEFLMVYTHSRAAAAELSASLLSLTAGAVTFRRITPGSVALGQAVAGAIAHHVAVANFVLGPSLGSVYYAAFPATASAGLVFAGVSGLMLALGTVSALTGVVTDPVQQALGLHERRLQQLLDALERELMGKTGSFDLRDAYLARVFDIVDLIRAAIRAVQT